MNSQAKFRCWSIENPTNRTIQKSFMTHLGPNESTDLVVVLQSPMKASCADLIAKLAITHVPSDDEASSFVEKRVGDSLESRPLQVEKKMNVLLCGKLQNPVLTCLKSITNPAQDDCTVIPIVAKIG